jgi:hypothetical protein
LYITFAEGADRITADYDRAAHGQSYMVADAPFPS